ASLHVCRLPRITTKEPFEKPRQNLRCDPETGVADGEIRTRVAPAQRNFHLSSGIIIFDGVIGKVQQQLPQAMTIALEENILAGAEVYLNIPGVRENLRVSEAIADQFVQRH